MTGVSSRDAAWTRVVLFAVLPGLALVLALAAGYVKFVGTTARDSEIAAASSIQAARDSAAAMLSYRSDTVEPQLTAATDRLTGTFRDSYSSLTRDVVIPGARQRQISSVATVPAAASVSATKDHAVVLLFVDQTVTVGKDAPSATRSTVMVTLDEVAGRWLVSDFDPK